jgi:RNA polymerase-interacting CarD/CdnL/TRCF family regulator
MTQVRDYLKLEHERTQPYVPRTRLIPDWLEKGQWVLIRRNGRFGRVYGEHQHSPRTVFEIVICQDGTRYLIPLDDVTRALRPIVPQQTAQRMLQIVRRPKQVETIVIDTAREILGSDNWANLLPETSAALLTHCYQLDEFRRGELCRMFLKLEQLVLTELALVLTLDRSQLQRELHQIHSILQTTQPRFRDDVG